MRPGLFTIDVVVTDPAGNPVSNLAPWDFTLLDDGQPAKIRTWNNSLATSGPASEPAPELIFVLDAVNLSPEQLTQTEGAIAHFLLQNNGHLQVPCFLYRLTREGLFSSLRPSMDGALLAKDLDGTRSLWTVESSSRSSVPGSPFLWVGTSQSNLLSLRALGSIAINQRDAPGHKVVVWMGPGWPVNTGNIGFDEATELSTHVEPATVKGDVAIIAGHAFPASIVPKRKKLEDRIKQNGFAETMEMLAYTWFNRFVAIRFMELHGYLEHGYQVLSHPDPTKGIPEILELAEHVDLPGLNREKVIHLKLDLNKEAELYRLLLLAQCHALHSAMPFLFEGIDDETELVLPENLLHSDSTIRKLVTASAAEDWREVEVLGWLYQYYVSERKDEVIARKSAVPTEDIPAATQLFTPHWIVRYLVENSLGRLWLLNRPSSKLREHMPYYIDSEPETDFRRISNPEELRVLDPACGSGHMLTYAFDLLFLIYTEQGYIPNEIPGLILQHNLHGLEICPRAAQLANLALVFKAREKSPQFTSSGNLVRPKVMELREVRFAQSELRDYIDALSLGDLFGEAVVRLMHQFEGAKDIGSLIQPCLDQPTISFVRDAIKSKDIGSQLFLFETHLKVLRVLDQAEALTKRYQLVITNPPYMGVKPMNARVQDFVTENFPIGKSDLYGAFIVRCLDLIESGARCAFITPPNWMFISSFEDLRQYLIHSCSITSLVHNGRGVWGPDFGSCSFCLSRSKTPNSRGRYRRLFVRDGEVNSNEVLERRFLDQDAFPVFVASSEDFVKIPGMPIAYWASERVLKAFGRGKLLGDCADVKRGMTTSDNSRFLRFWSEVSYQMIGFGMRDSDEALASRRKWFPYSKGGGFRKWYGFCEFVINWEENGRDVINFAKTINTSFTRTIVNIPYYFQPSIAFPYITIGRFSLRSLPAGFIYDSGGPGIFTDEENRRYLLALLNSEVAHKLLKILSPTINLQIADMVRFPVLPADVIEDSVVAKARQISSMAVEIAQSDWDNFETSWDFVDFPLLRQSLKRSTMEESWRNWAAQCSDAIRRMKELETENNCLFINAYGLQDELSPEVPEEHITLARADPRRDAAACLSYAVGCIMGRYSLDKPGIILANSGESRTEYLEKIGKPLDALTFHANEDGIIPVLDTEWFADDIVACMRDFLRTAFSEATLEANLRFIQECLGKELRRYFVTDFYKDHLQTYKRRPIYWLFSSGKERAFQALVYLHRYRESTLSRMRTEYVIPLQGKVASRIDQLASDIQESGSTSHRKKMEKERDTLLRQRTELQAFDEKLRHFADQRIQLDLDDGVKFNYAKLGDLLAEVKTVAGGSDE